MDVSLETPTPSLLVIHPGEESPEGSLQPTLPRALEELTSELSVFLMSLEIKWECGRLKK